MVVKRDLDCVIESFRVKMVFHFETVMEFVIFLAGQIHGSFVNNCA